ncbi:amidohydrolase family protein [Subsaximicrobium wynnwilliamsii]|uniref:Amidohydrolase family protein n=1 Tax=Subsaximicrobium wynnwilliamsii TaxID=291179 RepID=A0A5C6ZPC9_9FLAO|nr:amidohydrolase family protein [Subsaximicrobium wynnwilliamsii]TXD85513.1 amidohydrolase family protein [Subsaximicrobium wynnwilliamsii]TXD90866.1 amidohydrolase family protein [Subsaximicrobium wynnwilliamsii]TXE05373.1 amidohydrolase family protein [Subsaximicrobium wynnwilliamsii]
MKKSLQILILLLSVSVTGQSTYLHCGKLIDTKTGKVLTEKTIIVSDGRITSVENGYVQPKSEQDEVVDLKMKTAMPGLIDLHVHIESETNPKAYLETYTLNEADKAFKAAHYAIVTLMSGFTTVRDLGGTGVNVALRNAIAAGTVDGPRIFTAEKALATTGGHADPTNGSKRVLMGDPGPKEGVVNGVDDARKAVRQRYKNGADLIKITATGGVLSMAKSGQNPQFTLEEIKAICETAKDYGFHVAAHAHGDEGMQRAIKGGVKTIEHGTLMSDETMELMKQYDVYLVPTITAGKSVSEKAKIPGYYPEVIVPKALDIGPKIQDTFGSAYKKGVGIAFGTDAAVFTHGENGKEFGYMVEAGMPAMETIQSATITNAMLLKMEQELGQIKEGFIADIVAVNEDPTQNISTMENVVFVMKAGKIHKNAIE